MSGDRVGLDTNILVYSVDSKAGTRHRVAGDILLRAARRDCSLTLQALSEFYHVVTRKALMPRAQAAAQVEDWLTIFPAAPVTQRAIRAAMAHAGAGRASYWDALLVESSSDAGVSHLLSEDMADQGRLGAVTIVNPFADGLLSATARALLAL